jgi:hypothetical protein
MRNWAVRIDVDFELLRKPREVRKLSMLGENFSGQQPKVSGGL